MTKKPAPWEPSLSEVEAEHPQGLEIRDRGDGTHSLFLNGKPLTMEWLKSLPVLFMDQVDEDYFFPQDVAIIGRITTGRQYTWYTQDSEFQSDFETRFPGEEVLVYFLGKPKLFVFRDSVAKFTFQPEDELELRIARFSFSPLHSNMLPTLNLPSDLVLTLTELKGPQNV